LRFAGLQAAHTKEQILGVFMKKNIAIVSILLAAVAQTAFANGVEKVLPADAHNVKLTSASVGYLATGLVKTSDGNVDGPVYENTYTQVLTVVVKYDSKDDQDVSQRIEGESDLSYDATPTVYLDLPISDAEVAAIKAKKLDPKSLVSLAVSQQQVQFDKAIYTDACRYNNESGAPDNEATCVKHETVTESRPVVSVDRR
jgi:hypothetical protein